MCDSIADAFRATCDKSDLSTQIRRLVQGELRFCRSELLGAAAEVFSNGVLHGLHDGCIYRDTPMEAVIYGLGERMQLVRWSRICIMQYFNMQHDTYLSYVAQQIDE